MRKKRKATGHHAIQQPQLMGFLGGGCGYTAAVSCLTSFSNRLFKPVRE
jgi:hypothetical protein